MSNDNTIQNKNESTDIKAVNLNYSYPDKTKALSNINFKIKEGESVGIIGENGAGKSTLLMHLNGSLLPSSGEISIGKTAVIKKNLPEIRQYIGMVFQNPDDQLFMSSVFDDVAFGPLNMGMPENKIPECVHLALSNVGLIGIENRHPHHLSGGEKRRAAIATVLSMSPHILALDEPTSDLDPKSRRMLIELLKTFKHTKIIASHDLDFIADVCERTIIIFRGKIEKDAPTKEIFQDIDLLERCSLEPPLSMQNRVY
jgi:cobalt/nickel transport system ATP-binding protein